MNGFICEKEGIQDGREVSYFLLLIFFFVCYLVCFVVFELEALMLYVESVSPSMCYLLI